MAALPWRGRRGFSRVGLGPGPGGEARGRGGRLWCRLATNKVLLFSPFCLHHRFLKQLRAEEGEGLPDSSPNIW